MPEPEGVLPSRAASPIDDRGTLPAASPGAPDAPVAPDVRVAQAPPAAARSHEASGAPAEAQHEPPRPTTTSSLEARLAAIAAAGGLTALPPEFGDVDGDWSTVRSENPFVVLCLDPFQPDRVTPEIVSRHRDLLQRFWQEKLRSMSQGATRISILKKYGGPDESERLVRSYPDLIERAYEQLATRGVIEATARRLADERRSAVFTRVDEKLEDLLVDGVLQPEEVRVVLALGDREAVDRAAVAERVEQRLRQKGFAAASTPMGLTLEARLLSTAWLHPSRQPEPRAPVVVAGRKTLLVPVLAFSLVVVLVLLIAAALRSSRIETTAGGGAVSTTFIEAPLDTAGTQAVAVPSVTTSAEPPPAPPEPVPERTAVTPPRAVKEAPVPEPTPVEPRVVIDEKARRRVQTELAAIRVLADTDPQAALDRLAVLEQTVGEELVEERIEAVHVRAALEKALLLLEREREKGEAAERARLDRERDWERRLAAVEELMSQPNYTGAKTLADQLLADPDIPPETAERARELREHALAELQRIFSGAKVKAKTGRAPRRQR